VYIDFIKRWSNKSKKGSKPVPPTKATHFDDLPISNPLPNGPYIQYWAGFSNIYADNAFGKLYFLIINGTVLVSSQSNLGVCA
jgi:hypothetical protein